MIDKINQTKQNYCHSTSFNLCCIYDQKSLQGSCKCRKHYSAKREPTWVIFMTVSSFGSGTQKLVIIKNCQWLFFSNSLYVKTSSCLKLGIAFWSWEHQNCAGSAQHPYSPNPRRISAAARLVPGGFIFIKTIAKMCSLYYSCIKGQLLLKTPHGLKANKHGVKMTIRCTRRHMGCNSSSEPKCSKTFFPPISNSGFPLSDAKLLRGYKTLQRSPQEQMF